MTAAINREYCNFEAEEKRFPCAELVEVKWSAAAGQEHGEYAILAEVWTSGGVFLVEEPARRGTEVTIQLPHASVTGSVISCREEKCSWALEVQVETTAEWFGGRYEPAVLVLAEVISMNSQSGPRLVRSGNPVAAMLRTTIREQRTFHIHPRAS